MLKVSFLIIIVAAVLSGCAGYGGYAHHVSYPLDTQENGNYYYYEDEHLGGDGGGGGGC